jgi:hypothetical protein
MPSEERKCPKCGGVMQESVNVWYCMNPNCDIRWISKDGTAQEVYCGHEEKVKR